MLLGLFDTLRAKHALKTCIVFRLRFPVCSLVCDIPCEPKRHVLGYYLCEVAVLLSLSSDLSLESYHITSCVWFIIVWCDPRNEVCSAPDQKLVRISV